MKQPPRLPYKDFRALCYRTKSLELVAFKTRYCVSHLAGGELGFSKAVEAVIFRPVKGERGVSTFHVLDTGAPKRERETMSLAADFTQTRRAYNPLECGEYN